MRAVFALLEPLATVQCRRRLVDRVSTPQTLPPSKETAYQLSLLSVNLRIMKESVTHPFGIPDPFCILKNALNLEEHRIVPVCLWPPPATWH